MLVNASCAALIERARRSAERQQHQHAVVQQQEAGPLHSPVSEGDEEEEAAQHGWQTTATAAPLSHLTITNGSQLGAADHWDTSCTSSVASVGVHTDSDIPDDSTGDVSAGHVAPCADGDQGSDEDERQEAGSSAGALRLRTCGAGTYTPQAPRSAVYVTDWVAAPVLL